MISRWRRQPLVNDEVLTLSKFLVPFGLQKPLLSIESTSMKEKSGAQPLR